MTFLPWLAAAMLSLTATLAGAQPVDSLADGRGGEISFTSFGPRGHHELGQGTFDRTPVPISGKLLLPPGDGKVPAVVIGHTIGGVQPFLFDQWGKALTEAGYAVFVVDSFSARGLNKVWTKGPAEFSGAFLIPDAFQALKLLATHPRIDPQHIAFLGFSMGGGTAAYVLQERFRRAVLGDSPLHFAVAVGHYPHCHYDFYENQASTTPLYLFMGEKDDWTSPTACAAYADFLSARGYKVKTKVYEGAAHDYDSDHALRALPDAVTQRNCEPLLVNLDEPVLAPRFLRSGAPLAPGADTKGAAVRVYQWAQACTTRGVTSGTSAGNGDRRADAVRDTLQVLRASF